MLLKVPNRACVFGRGRGLPGRFGSGDSVATLAAIPDSSAAAGAAAAAAGVAAALEGCMLRLGPTVGESYCAVRSRARARSGVEDAKSPKRCSGGA
jgi:hypothetical protein